MYIFVNSNSIVAYNGEPIKLYVGGKLVKVICNPTSEDLAMVGYKELEVTEQPQYDDRTHYLVSHYEEQGNKIVQVWEVKEMEQNEVEQ